MSIMKSYLIKGLLIILIGYLTGCSTPPKPPKLNSDNYKSVYQDQLFRYPTSRLSPNEQIIKDFKDKSVIYTVVGAPIKESDKITVIFLATHADSIKIIGNKKNIYLYENYFRKIGIKCQFVTEEMVDKNEFVTFIFSGKQGDKIVKSK